MKTTGITRRIDELGRIVIPKEIRKNMHIKSGEMLEIYLDNPDMITLKKHSIINEGQSFLECFINNIGRKIKCDVYLISLNNIIFSTDNKVVGKPLSNSLEEMVNSSKLSFKECDELELTSECLIKKPFDVYAISPNGDLAGFLIFKYKEAPDDKTTEFIRFSTDFINDYLEEG